MEQVLHSLLQKAVRRGNTDMVNSVLQYFIQTDTTKQLRWLRNRLAVITAEECWPYLISASFENNESSLIHNYTQLTTTTKNKDAAGLGSVALAYKDKSFFVTPDLAIMELAELLLRPNYFWENTRKYKLDLDLNEISKDGIP